MTEENWKTETHHGSEAKVSTNTLRDLAELFLLALVVAVSIFVVDSLFFRDLVTLISALFFEGLALMLIGAAGWGEGQHDFFAAGWKRPKIYHVDRMPRYPDFWLALALAGLFLIFIDLYLVGQRY